MSIKIIKPDKRKPGKNGLRGKQGIQGIRGVQGVQGIPGKDGRDGLNGLNGKNGLDGQDGSKWYNGNGAPDATLGVTGDFYLDNVTYDYYEKTTRWIKRGNLKGAKGDKGEKGADGGVGTPGADGADGAQGPQGAQGMQGIQGDPGVGVPTGGTTGQILAKDSDTDYDTEWIDPVSGGISIGDTIGNSPVDNGLLYVNSSDELKNDLLSIQEDSFFGGVVTAKSFESTTYTNFPTLGWVDATGVGGAPSVGVLTAGLSAAYYFMIDTNTLSAKGALNYDASTPANSFFTIALANGLGGTPEFNITTTQSQLNVPLDMNSNKITELANGVASTDAANLGQVDAKVSDTAYGAGWDGVTTVAPSKNAVYDKIQALGSGTPGGSSGQIQYNSSGSFGGMSNVTKSGDGLLLSTVGNESFIAVGPQGYYGTAFAQDEPHVAINTVRLIGNGGAGLALRNNSNTNNIQLKVYQIASDQYVTPSNGIIGFYLTENAPNNASTITMASSDQGFFARKARLQVQAESGLISADATINTIQAKAQTSQTGNLFDAVNTSGTRLWGVDQAGGMKPASMADSAAANDTVYYSTDASKLVYKDSGGSVNNLY